MIQVSVCGPHTATPAETADAREVGRLLAENGAAVICGGSTGVMEAVAEGAASAGGLVIGILSRPTREGANPHLTVAVPTGLGQARNAVIALSGDAVIVVGGSWGTLSELALARRHAITVVQLGGWHLADADGRPVGGVLHANTPEEAVRLTGLF